MKHIDIQKKDIFSVSQLLDYREYYLLKENLIYKINIFKYSNTIIIKSKSYQKKFDLKELIKIANIKFNDIDAAYNFIIDSFNKNIVLIQNEIINKFIKLQIILEFERKIEFELLYYKYDEDIIINKINNMQKEINILKEENKKLNNEIEKLKKYHDKNNPKDIEILKMFLLILMHILI